MKRFKGLSEEQLHTIGKYVKTGCKFAAYGLVTVLSYSSITDEILRKIRYAGDIGYSDTVDAIMNSDMLGSYKREAVDTLLKDQDNEFYKAVVHIVNSDMMGSYKLDSIKRLCEKQ